MNYRRKLSLYLQKLIHHAWQPRRKKPGDVLQMATSGSGEVKKVILLSHSGAARVTTSQGPLPQGVLEACTFGRWNGNMAALP